jgi:tetratricopeptide (TPR) repeat protein
VALLEKAVRIDPGQAAAHNLLGAALVRVGRVPEGVAQLETALRERPDFVNARLNLAGALLRSGRFAESLEDYRQALAGAPGDRTVRDAIEWRVEQLEAEGRTKEAEELGQVLKQ